MKKLLCVILALLLVHSDRCNPVPSYYVCVVFQNGMSYEEYMNAPYLELMVRDFVSDSNIESVFISRDICVTDQ